MECNIHLAIVCVSMHVQFYLCNLSPHLFLFVNL